MCHALVQDPKFFTLLLRVDHELAEQARARGCDCGGVLHRSDFPRKPRGCSAQIRAEHSSRLSFCCAVCRRRSTPMSVRFLGQRVYLALAMVLVSARPAGPTPAAARLERELGVARRTLERWRGWWREQFPLTPLWRATCSRFMPPLAGEQLPAGAGRALCSIASRRAEARDARAADAAADLAQPGDDPRRAARGDRTRRWPLSIRRRCT